MGFEVHGLDKFKSNLDKVQKNIEDISGKHEVSFDKLFNDNFMKEHSKFNSFQELLDNSKFKPTTKEEFLAIPDDEWDVYIKENTNFESWKEMYQNAGQAYMAEQVKNAFKL